jgi:hypothetical protein
MAEKARRTRPTDAGGEVSPVRTVDLEAEWNTAQDALSKADALELALWLPKGVIMHMVGIARVRLSGGCYEPDHAGKWAFISPTRASHLCSKFCELPDLICWDIDTPDSWALRCGSAEWLGCVVRSHPTPIRRSPVDWLKHRCSGLVLLTQDRVRQYEILTDCNDIVAEDEIHADQLNTLLAYPYPRKAVFIA